jgi:glutathione-regulated potassium-efflux system ancillary protein KefC
MGSPATAEEADDSYRAPRASGSFLMTEVWGLAALWFSLAVVATLCAIWFRVSTALTEIIVGTLAQLILGALFGPAVLGTTTPWITFLAGAELDPVVFRRNGLGLVGFFAPFFGCAAVAYWVLGWGVPQSWLAGVALSTTSVAVVYAVMLEYGFNKTEYGKIGLAACFINDLGTVLALGFIVAPFSLNTAVFAAVAVAVCAALPWVTPTLFNVYGGRPSEFETKYLLLLLFALGAIAA